MIDSDFQRISLVIVCCRFTIKEASDYRDQVKVQSIIVTKASSSALVPCKTNFLNLKNSAIAINLVVIIIIFAMI